MLIGVKIKVCDLLEPDFYKIEDFSNARATSAPEWLSGIYMNGEFFMHPTTYNKMIAEQPKEGT